MRRMSGIKLRSRSECKEERGKETDFSKGRERSPLRAVVPWRALSLSLVTALLFSLFWGDTTVGFYTTHIQAGRVAKGLSQRELAKKLEVPKWLVKQWEEDQQTPTEAQWLSLGNICRLRKTVKLVDP